MNAGVEAHDPTITYYDGDYPSEYFSLYPENFDETTKFQGLRYDIPRYLELATQAAGNVLEICCGTGRVSIPLARHGFHMTSVDLSSGMLEQFHNNLQREEAATQSRIQLVEQDATQLALEEQGYSLAILAFNSLLCIPDFKAQCDVLRSVANHLAPDGILALDIVNPLNLKIQGDNVPKPFFTRRNPHTGNLYTRFAMVDAFDENHRQRLHGWYDECDAEGYVKRTFYSVYWRPIFRFEIELMLQQAGLEIVSLEGDHHKTPFNAQSPHMFIQAKKVSTPAR